MTDRFKAALLMGAAAVPCSAADLPRMFRDHGVLQQGEGLPVWGWGIPGENVTVEFGGRKMTGAGNSRGTVEGHEFPVGGVCMASGHSSEGLLTKPEGKSLVDALDAEIKIFKSENVGAWGNYKAELAEWEKRAGEIRKSGNTAGNKQRIPRRPGEPRPPALEPDIAATIYNGMIHPRGSFALSGAIRHQGGSNASRAKQYETIFPQMILHWRRFWKKELPFYFAQLANFKEPGVPDEWAELQNAQHLTLARPGTGMAVMSDTGMADNVDPADKQDADDRLTLWIEEQKLPPLGQQKSEP